MNRWKLCKSTFSAATLAWFLTGAALVAQSPATSAPRLEIHAVDGGPFPTEDAARQSVNGALPSHDEILPSSGNPDSSIGAPFYVIERSPIVAGNDFRSAQPGVDPNTGGITVGFTLTPEAGNRLWAFTSANIGKSMAVVMGGTVRSAAVIRGPLRDSGIIEGAFSQNEVKELAAALAAQPAPPHAGQSLTPRDTQPLVDFGGLAHFKEANMNLPPPAPGENRVVFMGDSITAGWRLADSFPGEPYINRGISGQTSPQMLVRFRQDVIALKPKAVIILAGTNDIAGNTGPMTSEQTEGNIASMADLATANGIRVVLCSVLPSFDFPWRPGLEPAPKIVAINAWITNYAAQKGYVYVDYYAAMADERGGLPATLSKDGVHPQPAGYAIMAPLAQAGIDKALKATR